MSEKSSTISLLGHACHDDCSDPCPWQTLDAAKAWWRVKEQHREIVRAMSRATEGFSDLCDRLDSIQRRLIDAEAEFWAHLFTLDADNRQANPQVYAKEGE